MPTPVSTSGHQPGEQPPEAQSTEAQPTEAQPTGAQPTGAQPTGVSSSNGLESPANTLDPVINLDDGFARAFPELVVEWAATAVPDPQIVALNEPLGAELGLKAHALCSDDGVATLAGNRVPVGARPVAMSYAGHQFGNYSPRLGDGRALLLGELVGPGDRRLDVHLKGSGRTPFARGGDGKATIGPMLREYLVAEAMSALGVPTTRALAVVTTGESVRRDLAEPGAVLTRVAASHLRVGTFEYAARLGVDGLVRRLADYAIACHHPEAAASETPYLAFLDAVVGAQAQLVARWMLTGFIHGVMNTDNMTISGEGIDYGPCAFMDRYNPATVFSSIDHAGRYAYRNQPPIATWNLARLAEALLPLIADEVGRPLDDQPGDQTDEPTDHPAIAIATDSLNRFATRYDLEWRAGMQAKLGLVAAPTDPELFADLLGVMADDRLDYTRTFRRLARSFDDLDEGEPTEPASSAALRSWVGRWRAQLSAEGRPVGVVAEEMNARNPAVVPRNHLVDETLQAATDGDLDPFNRLLVVVTNPFDEPDDPRMAQPAPEEFTARFRTFCGT